ncbi:MAG: hypothetical protein KJO65_07825, partial [Gemmatimonadetes bacterium]|nr:hypothetical protein [Gemmatimonadota bacterium]
MKKTALFLVALGVAIPLGGSTQALLAQEEAPAAAGQDPLFRTLFPPELIMQHRRTIGLNDEQRDAISRLISDLQGRVLGLQWELAAEVEELAVITGRPQVDL